MTEMKMIGIKKRPDIMVKQLENWTNLKPAFDGRVLVDHARRLDVQVAFHSFTMLAHRLPFGSLLQQAHRLP